MSPLKIVRVDAVPLQADPNTLYLVKKNDTTIDLYASSTDGLTVRHLATTEEILTKSLHVNDLPPALPSATQFWWNSAEGVLYVQYDDGDSVNWVEANPAPLYPEFGGTGTSNLMARADHNHDATYVTIGIHQW